MSAMNKRENKRSTAQGQKPSRSRAARSGRIGSPVRETRNANQERIESPRTNNAQNSALNAFSVPIRNIRGLLNGAPGGKRKTGQNGNETALEYISRSFFIQSCPVILSGPLQCVVVRPSARPSPIPTETRRRTA